MALFDELRRWAGRVGAKTSQALGDTKRMLETPIRGAGGMIDGTPATVRAALLIDDAEKARQKEVLASRLFHEGKNPVHLTDRLKEFLGSDEEIVALSLNVVAIVNMAVAERLEIAGWDCDAQSEEEKARQIAFAEMVWGGSRMKAKQADVFEENSVDGEHHILVSWDNENARPKWTPQPRYTDPTVFAENEKGDGDGMKVHYRNNDTSDKPEYVSKRWREHWSDERGRPKSEDRLTLYYPDRIEKYYRASGGWQAFIETDEAGNPLKWPIAWTDETGAPLGIPVVHCKTPRLRPEARRAWGTQKAISKTLLDLLIASDMTAFRILITYGWEMKKADGTPLSFAPGTNIGTMASDASHAIVDGANLQDIRDTIDKLITWVAGVTDTPASRFVMSGAVRAEGTLQEEKESLIAKVERRANLLETAFEDAMKIARRQYNLFGKGSEGFAPLDESANFKVLWKPFSQKSSEAKAAEAAALLASGVAPEIVQRTVWGMSEEDIDASRLARFGDGFPPRSADDEESAEESDATA